MKFVEIFFSLLMELLDKILRYLDMNLSMSQQCAVITKEILCLGLHYEDRGQQVKGSYFSFHLVFLRTDVEYCVQLWALHLRSVEKLKRL